jgi:TolB-like protein/tRNA A-37 threonylcarbamoyl transferase component Bud32/Flp pilus assembly protein TadD
VDETRVARLAELFERARVMPRAVRPAFLRVVCGDDDQLRQELSSLLDAHQSSAGFFEDLAAEVVSPVSAAVVAHGGADLMPELETVLQGSYRIERELSGGAMSRVFLAEELKLGRKVVIKVLPPELAATMSGERFRREIQLAAQLQHPHIVPLLTADSSGRLLYYTMPFIAGESLRARLARDGALPVREASKIWRDLLDALAHAHARRVVHRDIKPGNILLGERNALVTDFGIARAIEAAAEDVEATTPGLSIGTPAYMAPEQIAGEAGSDHRVDLYAAALVMYEMLEGRLPFSGRSSRELLSARLAELPRPIDRADCPRDLAAMVLQCLAKDPAGRPESAEALLAELETLPGSPDVTRGRVERRLAVYGLAALVVSAAALGVRYLRDDHPVGSEPAAPPHSVAVLPLANLSPEEGDAALADGMTEELIATLSRDGALRVVAGTSVRALKDRQLEVRQIAESLRASHILEGSLQKIGSKLRMQARLVDARDGSTRWSATYDRQFGDIFEVQDEIARAVAAELDVRLAAGGDPGARPRRYTPSIAAYEWYLRGKHTALLRSAEGRRQGVEYFTRAIAADSNFAAAHAGLVWLYLNEAGGNPADYRALRRRAEVEAQKAVALDATLAEAHSALGWARLAHRDWKAAEAAIRHAIALDPAVYRGYEGLARVYMFTGRPLEQLAAARRGRELDPFSVQAARELALALNMNGRCDETLELLRPLKDLDPPAAVAGVIRGQCYARKQMWPEAIAELRWALKTAEARSALAFLGYTLARGGRRDEAQAILSDLLAGRKDSHGAFGIAVVYTGLRDYEQAFTWLEKAMEEESWRPYILDPLFEDLHQDPRFHRLGPFDLLRRAPGSQNR